MTGEREGVDADALDDVAYLTRSPARVAVLEALTSESHSLRDLQDAVGSSRSTLSRTLSEFEAREWATRTSDGAYRATVQGRHLAVQLVPFLESVGTIRELDEALAAIPPSELTVGPTGEPLSLGAFDDVTVYRATPIEPDKLYQPWLDRMGDSDTLRVLAGAGLTEGANTFVHEEVMAGRLDVTAVCSGDLVDQLLDPDEGHATPEQMIDRHEVGGRLHRYDGIVPCNISLFDGAVFVSNLEADVGFDTENETVRTWAEEVFEHYLEDATLLGPDELAAYER